MGVGGLRRELLADIAPRRKAGAVHLLLDARSDRGRGGCLLHAFPAVGIELVAGAARLGPIVLAAATEREGPEQRDQGKKLHSPNSPHVIPLLCTDVIWHRVAFCISSPRK